MNTSTQDRLKAFLGRNRARASGPATEKEDMLPPEGSPTNKHDGSARLADNGTAPLSARFPSQREQMLSSKAVGMATEDNRNYTAGYEHTEEDSPQRRTVGDMRASKLKMKSFMHGESPLSKTQRSTTRNERTPPKTEAKRNNSTSPIRETRTPNKNLIESYISGKKKLGTKIRDHLKSLSKDPKKTVTPNKSNSMSVNYHSSVSRQMTSIDAFDQEATSARLHGSNNSKRATPVKEFSQIEKKVDKSKKSISQRQPSEVFSSGVKKNKEEKHEYAFEEAPKVNKTPRDLSRSKSRSISATPTTPKTVNKKEKKVEKSQQVIQRQQTEKPEKSPRKKSDQQGQQDDEMFPESSKRLKDLDSATTSESKFKKEIQKLIEIIKSEKEHITKNMESMSSELLKYKNAYKKLKKKYQHQKEKKEASGEKKSSKNNENFLAGAEEGEGQNSFHGSAPYSSSNKALSVKKQEENYVPFTIDELNKHLDSNIPNHTNENPLELLSKMEDINLDVQNIVAAKNTLEENLSNRDSNYNSNFETHSFQLRRNPINCYIIKEMNLASHLFFQDALKETEQETDFTPTVIDLLAAQREIIHFLIRKIEIEEKQRLKTEEQANTMIIQMEKTIKQLEERGPGSRKRESPSTTELNKSGISQIA